MNQALMVVDVQPAYRNWCAPVARQVAQRINNTRKPVIIFWVGDDITDDTESEVREYLREAGAYGPRLEQATFVEKGYGFFRGWMDSCVRSDIIIQTGKQLLARNLRSSEDLDLADLLGLPETELPTYDHIHLPHFDDSSLLSFDSLETCGGGSRACLAEMELYLQMHDKPYKRLEHLTY
ncbi:hypothetical protein ACOTHJ_15675 [Achromobacter xylosoxidans]